MPTHLSITLSIFVVSLIAVGFSLKSTYSDMQHGRMVEATVTEATRTKAMNIHKRLEDALDLTLTFQDETGSTLTAPLRIWNEELANMDAPPQVGDTLSLLWNTQHQSLSRDTVPTSLWHGGVIFFTPLAGLALLALAISLVLWRRGT